MKIARKVAQGLFWSIPLISILILLHTAKTEATCPVFGTNQSRPNQRDILTGIILNFEAPSQCKGNVTAWKFCYHRPVTTSFLGLIIATFAVYRRQPLTDTYASVLGSGTVARLNSDDMDLDFECAVINLTSDEWFKIQENDIIGACIRTTVQNLRPSIISSTSEDDLIYRRPRSCSIRNEVVVNMSQLSLTSNRMHLSAEIASNTNCTLGSKLQPSESPPTSSLPGTYLSSGSSVMKCGNHITKWHYCYYTEDVEHGETLSMIAAVWTLDRASDTYIVSPGSIMNITVQHVLTLAKIFCMEEPLNETQYIPVSNESVIGVVLPPDNPIPIINSNPGPDIFILKHANKDVPHSFLQQESSNMNSGLHLHATVENLAVTTTYPIAITSETFTISGATNSRTTDLNPYSSTIKNPVTTVTDPDSSVIDNAGSTDPDSSTFDNAGSIVPVDRDMSTSNPASLPTGAVATDQTISTRMNPTPDSLTRASAEDNMAVQAEGEMTSSASDVIGKPEVILPPIMFVIVVTVVIVTVISSIVIHIKRRKHEYDDVIYPNKTSPNDLRRSSQNGKEFNMVNNVAYHTKFSQFRRKISVHLRYANPLVNPIIETNGAHNTCEENNYAFIEDPKDHSYVLVR